MPSPELIATLNKLPESLQQEALHYAEFLAQKYATEQTQTSPPKKYRQAGTMQGLIVMSDDFDAPLEDLKDYL